MGISQKKTDGSEVAKQYDGIRREMARATLPASPQAYSIDGRTFGYEIPLKQALPVGSYVSITTQNASYLGQITDQNVVIREGPQYGIGLDPEGLLQLKSSNSDPHFVDRVRIRDVQGGGDLIGRSTPSGVRPTTGCDVFEEGALEPASVQTITSYHAIKGEGQLNVGYALGTEAGKARVQLWPKGFRRHTFMCGQSRSGKTFALGVIIEQLLLAAADLRIIVIDPNSDFVRLAQIRTKEEHDLALHATSSDEEYSMRKRRYQPLLSAIRVLRPEPFSPPGLKIRLSDLGSDEQAGVLSLHPTRDLKAFNTFSGILDRFRGRQYSWQDVVDTRKGDAHGYASELYMRIANLRVADWAVWCKGQEPSMQEVMKQEDWRCVVADVGSLPSSAERALVAVAVLSHVWKTKDRSKPVLLVLDEAHNICPQEPTSQIQEIATDYLTSIAGEGLKYGVRLLLVSQRPAKIHTSVLTQCENLILMRMNSRADLESLTHTFSQVPATLMAQSRYFSQGESLIAGEIAVSPTFAKFEGRLTQEGGGDVPATAA